MEIPVSPLCPVAAFKKMCGVCEADGSDPAFCLPKGVRRTPVTYKILQDVLKRLISTIGLDPSLFSSHSFRRGGCHVGIPEPGSR